MAIIPLTKTAMPDTIMAENTVWNPDQRSLWEFIGESLAVLWKDWPRDMQAKCIPNKAQEFSLQGTCPHCSLPSTFLMKTPAYAEYPQPGRSTHHRLWAVLQCQGCLSFICGAVRRDSTNDSAPESTIYFTHYPIGKPDDRVASDIPESIANDFKEALRCRWVDAYNATVEMCRRAFQSSCDNLQAAGSNLYEQIDDLALKAVITKPLKEMAHKVRLGGNRGAHPSSKQLSDRDADAVITFTRHYFEHVYVMPAALAAVDFEKPTS